MTEEELMKFGGGFLNTVQKLKDREKVLIDAGNVLTRALGHVPGCPKISPALPCTCGEGAKQAQALDDWMHLVKTIKES